MCNCNVPFKDTTAAVCLGFIRYCCYIHCTVLTITVNSRLCYTAIMSMNMNN